MFKWVNPKTKIEAELSVPEHVAIIMDGNGRWAKNVVSLASWVTGKG